MPHNKKDILLDQLAACHDDKSWFPSLKEALDGITAEQAAWKEDQTSNSIWQLVKHLTFWNQTWLDRFTGHAVWEKIQNEITFDAATLEITEDNWRAAVANLQASLSDWRKSLEASPETKLDEQVPNFPADVQWWGVISNLCTHNAYHIGQIVLIQKKIK